MEKLKYTEPWTTLHIVEMETPFCQTDSQLKSVKTQVQVEQWVEGFDDAAYSLDTGSGTPGAAIIDFDK